MKTAAIYARYSSERQTEQSIEGQIRVCKEYAERNDLVILETYIDRATTGTNDNRAAFQKMLSDSDKSAPWDIVLVYAIDRFGRNSIEVAVNKQRLQKNGKILISATQRTSTNIDGSKNLDGILLENLLIGLSEYYSAELSQKVRRGQNESREKGYFTGGTLPYGYKVIEKKIYADEERAEVVRYIFQQYASSMTANEIIRDLTAKGLYHNGKPFQPNAIYGILNLEKYKGIYRYGEKIYTNLYPRIVSNSLFDNVQRRLEKNKIGSFSRNTEFLLKGKLYCGLCGKHINGESGTCRNGVIKYYYKCASRKKKNVNCAKSTVGKEKLENLIITVTQKLLKNDENISIIADAIMRVREERNKNQTLLKLLTEEKTATQKTLDNIMAAVEQGIVTATTKTRLIELEKKIEDLNLKIRLEALRKTNEITKEDITRFLKKAIRKSTKLMLDILIRKIILYEDKIEIYYNCNDQFPPDESPEDRRDFIFIEGSNFFFCVPPYKTQSNLFVNERGFGLCLFLSDE